MGSDWDRIGIEVGSKWDQSGIGLGLGWDRSGIGWGLGNFFQTGNWLQSCHVRTAATIHGQLKQDKALLIVSTKML